MIGPFLIKLVEQPDVLGHYLRDPEGAMEAAELSPTEREILRGGSLKRLREALQEEYPDREIFLGHIPPPIGLFGHVPQTRPPDPPDQTES
jgi:hypothetical protein